MYHVGKFLALIYNNSVMATAPNHRDIRWDEVVVGYGDVAEGYTITIGELARAEHMLALNPELAKEFLLDNGDWDPLLDKVVNWYGNQIGII